RHASARRGEEGSCLVVETALGLTNLSAGAAGAAATETASASAGLHGVACGRLEERRIRFRAIDVVQLANGGAEARIGGLFQDRHLEVRRYPAFKRGLDSLRVADGSGRNGVGHARSVGHHAVDALRSEVFRLDVG